MVKWFGIYLGSDIPKDHAQQQWTSTCELKE
jgi:hypothetical protein